LTHTPPLFLKRPYVARSSTRQFQVFRFIANHDDHANIANSNRAIHALRGRQGWVKKNSRTQSAAFHTIHGSLDSAISASRFQSPAVRRRDRLPTPLAPSNKSGFHSQVDSSGQSSDQQSQTSNCSGRANRGQEEN